MTPKELAAEWRQHIATVYRKIHTGEIRAVRLGGGTSAWRIPRAELERLFDEQGLAPKDPAERDGAPDLPAVEAHAHGGEKQAR